LAIMSQVAKSASALVRAFLAILVLELEDMLVRLFRPPKFAGVHGYRWTVRLGISVDVRCSADEISDWLQLRQYHTGIDAPGNTGVD
jgi:hypothetical protein